MTDENIGANQKKTDYICISKESEGPAPDTLDETLPSVLINDNAHPKAPQCRRKSRNRPATPNTRNSGIKQRNNRHQRDKKSRKLSLRIHISTIFTQFLTAPCCLKYMSE